MNLAAIVYVVVLAAQQAAACLQDSRLALCEVWLLLCTLSVVEEVL